MAKQDPTKRQRQADARRKAIMSSYAFQEWWSARRNIHPVPSDPFRAFMIDLGLEAKIHRKEVWRGRTNRADYPPVDLPSFVPSPKRRMPSRKEERRFKRVPEAAKPYAEKTEIEKELDSLAEQMSEKFHVAKPKIYPERREGALTSAYFPYGIVGLQPFIKIGVKGKSKPQILGTFEHEFGHHVHARGGLPSGTSQLSVGYREAGRIEREHKAWEFADPFMQQRRQEQKWLKQHALGTYTGKVKPSIVQRFQSIRLQPIGIRSAKRQRS